MSSIKLLCISDKVDPLIYSSNIKNRFKDIDLILSAGDLELNYYGFIVSSLNKPLLFVFGNHNLKSLSNYRKNNSESRYNNSDLYADSRKSYGSIYIGDRAKNIKSILIAGLGGSRKYNGGPNQYSEIDMFFKILKLIPRLLFNRIYYGRWLDILLTHAPPRDIGDREDKCHQGFKVFKTFLKFFNPKYHLHGHIHLYDINSQRESIYN
nr:metallophosphoesterase [Spirochaetia bacterium]